MDSKKLLKTLSTQNHGMLRFSVHELGIQRERERKGPGPSSVSKDKDSSHTFNNKQQNCMVCKLLKNDLRHGHVHGHCLLDDIATSIG